MPKLIAFTVVGYNEISKELSNNDPDITLNGDDATLQSDNARCGNQGNGMPLPIIAIILAIQSPLQKLPLP